MGNRVRVVVGLGLAVCLALGIGCGAEGDAGSGADASSARAESSPATKPKRSERPLPGFSGWTLDGERIDVSNLIGKRLVVFVFDPSQSDSAPVAQAMARVSAVRDEHNFQVLGIAAGPDKKSAQAYASLHSLDFPILDDSSKRIAGRFGLPGNLAALGVDADGYVVWGFAHFPVTAPDAVDRIEKQLRTSLHLPEEGEAGLAERPVAPTFTARVLDEDEPFDLADTRGKPVVLIFFLHTCPHCHEALKFLKTALADLPEDKQPVFVGLELTGRTGAVRSRLKADGLDFFKVLFDDTGRVPGAYGSYSGVPDLFLIDRQGRIAGRVQGWRPEIDAPVLRMRLAKLVGAPVPMLLASQGYSGNEVCGVCHESEHQTWQITSHARAFSTLVEHGSDSDPECVGCHVVGFGETGGFQISPRSEALEDVGCESCHGRGGPHLSPGAVQDGNYEPLCVTCHDPKHSLGFEYAGFLPRVSHAANAHILELPAEERQRILAERGAARAELLPSAADHVGSEACRSCHPKEFETWAQGPHAGALASLETEGKSAETDCLRCHTTGFGRPGGFAEGAAAQDHPDLARVGCESCHGPGGDHVAESATKLGSILSLGDKCDSCVILRICGSCHDDANDPGFEFEVLDKIDRIRHGTIEAGTGRPLEPGESAALPHPSMDVALLTRAFAAAAHGRAASDPR